MRRINDLSGRALSERRYSDVPHKVFTSPRRVVFREMEYAVPREVALDALREVRATDRRPATGRSASRSRSASCPADDVPLSTAYQRDSVYLAFHMNPQTDHTGYFRGVEDVLRALRRPPPLGQAAHPHRGRPRAGVPPLGGRSRPMRDRLDPDRVFTNPYLDRVLGP